MRTWLSSQILLAPSSAVAWAQAQSPATLNRPQVTKSTIICHVTTLTHYSFYSKTNRCCRWWTYWLDCHYSRPLVRPFDPVRAPFQPDPAACVCADPVLCRGHDDDFARGNSVGRCRRRWERDGLDVFQPPVEFTTTDAVILFASRLTNR